MARQFHELDALQANDDYWVFFRSHPNHPAQLRSTCRALACPKCGTFDAQKTLENGIESDVGTPATSRDAFLSCDYCLVVSARSRSVIEAVAPREARFFPIPNTEFFVLYPITVIDPPPDTKTYMPLEPARNGEPFQFRSKPCRRCGRRKCVTFQSQWFTVPDVGNLVGVRIETGLYSMITLAASHVLCAAVIESGLTGWRVYKDAFRN